VAIRRTEEDTLRGGFARRNKHNKRIISLCAIEKERYTQEEGGLKKLEMINPIAGNCGILRDRVRDQKGVRGRTWKHLPQYKPATIAVRKSITACSLNGGKKGQGKMKEEQKGCRSLFETLSHRVSLGEKIGGRALALWNLSPRSA